jgi:hypothetical protein
VNQYSVKQLSEGHAIEVSTDSLMTDLLITVLLNQGAESIGKQCFKAAGKFLAEERIQCPPVTV